MNNTSLQPQPQVKQVRPQQVSSDTPVQPPATHDSDIETGGKIIGRGLKRMFEAVIANENLEDNDEVKMDQLQIFLLWRSNHMRCLIQKSCQRNSKGVCTHFPSREKV